MLLPIDIAQSYDADHDPEPLERAWVVVYWITFMLTWVVDPILQVRVTALHSSSLLQSQPFIRGNAAHTRTHTHTHTHTRTHAHTHTPPMC